MACRCTAFAVVGMFSVLGDMLGDLLLADVICDASALEHVVATGCWLLGTSSLLLGCVLLCCASCVS